MQLALATIIALIIVSSAWIPMKLSFNCRHGGSDGPNSSVIVAGALLREEMQKIFAEYGPRTPEDQMYYILREKKKYLLNVLDVQLQDGYQVWAYCHPGGLCTLECDTSKSGQIPQHFRKSENFSLASVTAIQGWKEYADYSEFVREHLEIALEEFNSEKTEEAVAGVRRKDSEESRDDEEDRDYEEVQNNENDQNADLLPTTPTPANTRSTSDTLLTLTLSLLLTLTLVIFVIIIVKRVRLRSRTDRPVQQQIELGALIKQ